MEGTTRNLETNFEVKENLYDFKESFVNFPKPFAFRIEWQLYVGLFWFFFKLGLCLYHSIHLQNYYVYRFPATIIGVISIFSCSSVSWVESLSLGGRFDRSPETKTLALIIYKYPFSFQKILYNCRSCVVETSLNFLQSNQVQTIKIRLPLKSVFTRWNVGIL